MPGHLHDPALITGALQVPKQHMQATQVDELNTSQVKLNSAASAPFQKPQALVETRSRGNVQAPSQNHPNRVLPFVVLGDRKLSVGGLHRIEASRGAEKPQGRRFISTPPAAP